MATHCSCGSPLPDGAYFCPRCGRPLAPGAGEPADPYEQPSEPSVGLPEPARPGREAYFRAAIFPALGAMLLRLSMSIASPWLALFSFLVPGAAGYLTVRLYEQRHALVRSRWQGCGLGALAGLLCFVPSFLLQIAVILTEGREAVLGPMREQAGNLPMGSEMVEFLEDPAVFAMTVAFGLLFEAIVLVGISGAGGGRGGYGRAEGRPDC